ncbi:hypothetical protein BOTBODRAFT_149441 [Botryobasidium botryosum FD-172 SS1]|uniref:Uncharacterized protein n=1 Tax=Botryobasidium botryosum (strain FD-172 SS1) TaxID=930990 RepID=A0A067LUI8_BOTB1|nr:hypothetical protein BOTBODRAFT_149441 [Botryobasidium botryosum FD-172 SS1]
MESSTNDVHAHAAIRATAGLSLDGEELRILEDAGLEDLAVSRGRALLLRHSWNELAKFEAEHAMIMIAAARYPALGGAYLDGNLSNHEDVNIACLCKCEVARDYFRIGMHEASYTWLKSVESIFQEHTSVLRKRVLMTLFRALRLVPMSEVDDDGNPIGGAYFLDPKTIDLTLSLLNSNDRPRPYRALILSDFDRAIISLWQSEPTVTALRSTFSLRGTLPDTRAILYALAAFLTPESSDERLVAGCDLLLELESWHLLPRTSDDRDFLLLRSIHESLTKALSLVQRPTQVWTHVIDTLYALHELGVQSSFGDGPDFALACARRVSQLRMNAGQIIEMGKQPFWYALSDLCQEGTVG